MKMTLLAGMALTSAIALTAQPLAQPTQTPEPEPGEFTADRPGFGVPTQVLPAGVLQFEGGFAWNSEAGQNTSQRTLTWGSPLARFGVGSNTEIRFGGDGFLSSRTVDTGHAVQARGWSDFSLGAKIALYPGHGLWPAFSLIPTISLPLGGPLFTSSAVDPSLTLAWSTNLPAKWSAGGTIGLASVSDGAGRFAQRTQAVSVGRALFAGLNGYVEAYHMSPAARGSDGTWMLDGGMTHALGRNAQLDLEAGRRVVSSTSCWFASLGFAIRRK